MRHVLILIALLLAAPLDAGALVGEDPQEARVREVATQLRCPVCQSENILDSHSGTAREMLDLVREQTAEGRSNAEIMSFFQTRYGDYVLLSPPASGPGFVIWWIPALLAVGGAGLGLVLVRRLKRRGPAAGPLRNPLSVRDLEEMEP
ncbi:cytochrome c-type biogenesis protein CcmH [Roseovarius spongiae]|uniref:Cytochrome c-type biogenesis protein n=1 Tax=Roseovarius spongiae TaxID=2320272 RepID=A0A3A8B201_9RHOB|nr:cytochrome c-type biogenesis protein [Roseovarius spongiae]RKF12856.1 cytochrome c-type biogenesis protein CcmH [Roseovarius spongiae]